MQKNRVEEEVSVIHEESALKWSDNISDSYLIQSTLYGRQHDTNGVKMCIRDRNKSV